MSGEFARRVEQGLHLSRRIYYGKGVKTPAVPEPPPAKSSPESFLPTAIMAYASIFDPAAVDNPDVPSYQPYVHARCEPPALLPLHMLAVEMTINCWLDTAFVTISGRWRVHCLMASKRSDCCLAVPMGDQGSLLGADINIVSDGRSYKTKLVTEEESAEMENVYRDKDSRFVKSHIHTFKIPQMDGGSVFSVQVSWSQKLTYREGHFHLNVPFKFPAYVIPVGKDRAKIEKVSLNLHSDISRDIICRRTSHPMKMLHRGIGKLSCQYEAEVSAWSNIDFDVSLDVSSGDVTGNVLVKSPSPWDSDDRGMFCLYLLPGTNLHRQVFKRSVVFVIDISGSMQGGLLEDVKRAVLASLGRINPEDSFNIIIFNEEIRVFSSSMELATVEAISTVTHWLNSNLIAAGGTNILAPLEQAMKLLEGCDNVIPLVFLVTDGSVENERQICNSMREYCCRNEWSISPRICTFGIGSFCNHYFLQMLAQDRKGCYDRTYDTDSIELRLMRLFETASSTIMTSTTLDALKFLSSVELFPSEIPDLTLGKPLILSGRYKGQFPDSIELRGTLADMSCFRMELTVQKSNDMPLDKVLARRQIDELIARAWLEEKKELEEKATRLSIQAGFPCEYTEMILLKSDGEKILAKPISIKEILRNPAYQIQKQMESSIQKTIILRNQRLGFGNVAATVKNMPPGREEPKDPEGAELLVKAAAGCCSRIAARFCCMCFLQSCSHLNDQCTIVFSQLCAALACFECLSCCCDVCDCLDF